MSEEQEQVQVQKKRKSTKTEKAWYVIIFASFISAVIYLIYLPIRAAGFLLSLIKD
ncbi:MAG: hypothetical protein JSW11_03655 [Candidatus Heimdallarchaeota archaeon]|nr:MAG: hypothetical protein JSW11_03655 [Candidatus Heimdallarchaeota archaeon]